MKIKQLIITYVKSIRTVNAVLQLTMTHGFTFT